MSKMINNPEFHPTLIVSLAIILLVSGMVISCRNSKTPGKHKPLIQTELGHPDWSKNAAIYEVNLRQYSPDGSLKSFEKHLPRLKKMGVKILWLMPIHPIGVVNRKATPELNFSEITDTTERAKYLGSYYSVKDYYAIDSMYGTMEEFKAFVEHAHSEGFKVILDWVANHTAWDNPWIEQHPDWYTRDDSGNIVSPYDWTDVADLNYDNQDLRAEMINAMSFWLKEAKIDGFRCDVAMMVPADFWNTARAELEKINPDIFMLAEAEEPDLQLKAFDMYYGWELHHITKQIAKGEKGVSAIDSYLNKADTVFPAGTYRMNFTSNHDENSWNGTVYERYGDAVKAMAVLVSTLQDMPLVYSGQEAGMDKSLKFFEKDEIEWNDHEFAELYRVLFELKKENQALWNGSYGGNFVRINSLNKEQVFAFLRTKNEQAVLVILNLSSEPCNAELKTGKRFYGAYVDVLTGKEWEVDKKFNPKLMPWEFLILEKH